MDDVGAKALHIFHESDPILSHLLTEFQHERRILCKAKFGYGKNKAITRR